MTLFFAFFTTSGNLFFLCCASVMDSPIFRDASSVTIASITGASMSAFLWLSHTAVTHPAANISSAAASHSHLCSLNISFRLTLIMSSSRPLHGLVP